MKILFLINVGRRDEGPPDELLGEFQSLLDSSGHIYKIVTCGSIGESNACLDELVRKKDFDTLWIGGGDGTLNSILNKTFGEKITYGFVPMGTVNALVRSLGIPEDPVDAVKYLLEAEVIPLDVGQCNELYFFTYASVGIHAAVFHNIDVELKKRWGKLAFWESGIRTIWQKSKLPKFRMQLEVVDENTGRLRTEYDMGFSFVLSNFANYAGFGLVMDSNPGNEGMFDLHSFRKRALGPMFMWYAVLKLIGFRKFDKESGNLHRKVTECIMRSKRKVSVQIDGEPIKPKNRKELRFACLKGACQVLLKKEHTEVV